jgi:hypothetical protein
MPAVAKKNVSCFDQTSSVGRGKVGTLKSPSNLRALLEIRLLVQSTDNDTIRTQSAAVVQSADEHVSRTSHLDSPLERGARYDASVLRTSWFELGVAAAVFGPRPLAGLLAASCLIDGNWMAD